MGGSKQDGQGDDGAHFLVQIVAAGRTIFFTDFAYISASRAVYRVRTDGDEVASAVFTNLGFALHQLSAVWALDVRFLCWNIWVWRDNSLEDECNDQADQWGKDERKEKYAEPTTAFTASDPTGEDG